MEINVVENLVVPETPRTSDVQKIMVYMPYASHSTEGIAKFDSNDFMFTPRGVSLRHSLTNRRVIVDFVVDPATGKGTIVYNDNTKYSFTFPTIHEDVFRNEITKTIEFAENSFLYDNDNDVYYLTFSNDMTKQSTSEYLIQIEETVENGYDVVFLDTFKGNDGSLIISAALPFDGRVTIVDSVLLLDLEKLHNAELNLNIKNGEGIGSIQSSNLSDDDEPYTTDELPIASGHEAIAFGKKVVASGKRSIAIGNTAISSGNASLAIGQIVEASNSAAIALGNGTKATGMYSMAIGQENEANGSRSFAAGWKTKANSEWATTFGVRNVADGQATFVTGIDNESTSYAGLTSGTGNHNNSEKSLVIGNKNTNSGSCSITAGKNNTNASTDGLTIGHYNINNGARSIITGGGSIEYEGNVSYGNSSAILGGYSNRIGISAETPTNYNVIAGGNANVIYNGSRNFVSGAGNTVYGSYKTVFGYQNTTFDDSSSQFVCGKLSKANADALFIVGKGETGKRENAFEVLKDGRAKVYKAPQEDNDVVRWGDIKNGINNIVIVDNLPTSGISLNSLYLVPVDDGTGVNKYIEYIYRNNSWEIVGTTGSVDIDTGPIYARIEAIEDVLKDKDGNFVITKGKWSELIQDLNGIRVNVGEIETDIDSMTTDIAAVTATATGLQSSYSEVVSKLNAQADAFEILQTNTSKLEQTAEAIRTKVAAIEGDYVAASTFEQTAKGISTRVEVIEKNFVTASTFELTAAEIRATLETKANYGDYYTKAEVDKEIADVITQGTANLNGYVTKQQIGYTLTELRKLTGLGAAFSLEYLDGQEGRDEEQATDVNGNKLYLDKDGYIVTENTGTPLYRYRITGFADDIFLAGGKIAIDASQNLTIGDWSVGHGLYTPITAFNPFEEALQIDYISQTSSYFGEVELITEFFEDDIEMMYSAVRLTEHDTTGTERTTDVILQSPIGLNMSTSNAKMSALMLTADNHRLTVLPTGLSFQRAVYDDVSQRYRIRSSALYLDDDGNFALHNAKLTGARAEVDTGSTRGNPGLRFNFVNGSFFEVSDRGVDTSEVTIGGMRYTSKGLVFGDKLSNLGINKAPALVFDVDTENAGHDYDLYLSAEYQGQIGNGLIPQNVYKLKLTATEPLPITKTFYVMHGTTLRSITINKGDTVGLSSEFRVSGATGLRPDDYGLTNPTGDLTLAFPDQDNKHVQYRHIIDGYFRLYGDLIPAVGSNLGKFDNRWAHGYFTDITCTNEVQDSDRNKKYDIEYMSDDCSSLFDKLKPVTYKWKDGVGDTHIGFIAQEVKDSLDELGINNYGIYQEFDNGCGLSYNEFIAMCVYEIQKLKKRVAELENK